MSSLRPQLFAICMNNLHRLMLEAAEWLCTVPGDGLAKSSVTVILGLYPVRKRATSLSNL